jgi:DNA invertase Pin-like site-specific DNA recombinase
MIRERVNAGLARARAKGKVLGRPKAAPEVEERILELAAEGTGKVKTARMLGIGVSVVQRIIRAT